MPVPNLKRIKVGSDQELRNWLGKNAEERQVLIVACDKKSPRKFVSREAVHDALLDHGWTPGMSYTLQGNLVGYVAKYA